MNSSFVRRVAIAFAASSLFTSTGSAFAQEAATRRPPSSIHLVTMSPLGWPGGRIDAEWQACASDAYGNPACALRLGLRLTAGRSNIGTRHRSTAASRPYRELDAVLRLNPVLTAGPDPSGWTVGVRAGLTHTSGSLPFPGLGVEIERTWRLGHRVLVGGGAGVKGVMVLADDPAFDAMPVLRPFAGFAF